MKCISLFLLFCFAGAISVFCQSITNLVSKINIEENDNKEGRQEYLFEYKNKKIQRIINGDDIVMDYVYNKDGQLLALYRFPLQNEEDTIMRVKYKYDAEKRLQSILIENYDESGLYSTKKVVNLYDSKMKLIKQTLFEKESANFIKLKDFSFEYDDKDNVASAQIVSYNSKSKVSERIKLKYSYDKGLNLGPIDPIFALDPFNRPVLSVNNPTSIELIEIKNQKRASDVKKINLTWKFDSKKNPISIESSDGWMVNVKY